MRVSPVRDAEGNVIVYDIYLNGEWVGSRRTKEQCASLIRQRRK